MGCRGSQSSGGCLCLLQSFCLCCRGAWERLVLLGSALAKYTPVAPDSAFCSFVPHPQLTYLGIPSKLGLI